MFNAVSSFSLAEASLCHRENGEKEKERRAWDDGKGKEKKIGRHSFSLPVIHRYLSRAATSLGSAKGPQGVNCADLCSNCPNSCACACSGGQCTVHCS